MAAAVVLIRQMTQNPLGPALAVSELNKEPEGIAVSGSEGKPQAAVAAVKKPTETPKRWCGNKGSLTILVVGSDAEPYVWRRGADLVRYVKVDFDAHKVTIFSLPRDLWLDTSKIKALNMEATTLGQVYDFGYTVTPPEANAKTDQHQVVEATNMVAQTVFDAFGLAPDHYVAVKLSSFPEMIDTIGGLTIEVPERMVTTSDPPVTFDPGVQTMDGERTAWYVRHLGNDMTEWDRMQRQNLVLDALYEKLEDPAILTKVPELFKQFTEAIVTDLSPEQVADLACVLKEVPDNQIVKETVHAEMVSVQPDRVMIPDLKLIKELLKTSGMLKK